MGFPPQQVISGGTGASNKANTFSSISLKIGVTIR
jgi:hypothetical protein